MFHNFKFSHLIAVIIPALVVTILLALVARHQSPLPQIAALAAPETDAPVDTPSPTPSPTPTTPVRVPILMYHSVESDPARSNDYVITPTLFRADMEYLRDHGYTTVFISDLYAYETAGTPLPEKPVVITLDDGYLNGLTAVLPILQDTGMKAVISIVGEYSQRYTENGDRSSDYAYLTWDDIRALHDSGAVEIGNHSWGMHTIGVRRGAVKMAGESSSDYQQALTKDLSRLQTTLTQNSGVTPTVFAYPYGFYCNESLPVLKKLGFTAAITCEKKLNSLTGDADELYHLGRFNRPAGISTESFMKCLQP